MNANKVHLILLVVTAYFTVSTCLERSINSDNDADEICGQPKRTGTCRAFIPSFHYNPYTKKCEFFIFGGCRGNQNRFPSIVECYEKCNGSNPALYHTTPSPTYPPEIADVCKQPRHYGSGVEKMTRYYYSLIMEGCFPFIWTGQGGNDNNFNSSEDCENQCLNSTQSVNITSPSLHAAQISTANDTKEPEDLSAGKCFQEPSSSNSSCNTTSSRRVYRYSYDSFLNLCYATYISECLDGGNSFKDEDSCRQTCHELPKNDSICLLPMAFGEYCSSEKLTYNYFYNAAKRMCEVHHYRGCGGNSNRFSSYHHCYETCQLPDFEKVIAGQAQRPSEIGKRLEFVTSSKCFQPEDMGEFCDKYDTVHEFKFFFNAITARCEILYYRGCAGNYNWFGSSRECQRECLS